MQAELSFKAISAGMCLRSEVWRKGNMFLVELWKSHVHKFNRIVYFCLLCIGYSSDLGKSFKMWIPWSNEIDDKREFLLLRLTSPGKFRSTGKKPSHTFSIILIFSLFIFRVIDRQNQDKTLTQVIFPMIFQLYFFFLALAVFNSFLFASGGKISPLTFTLAVLCWHPSELLCISAKLWCCRLDTGVSLQLCGGSDFMSHTSLLRPLLKNQNHPLMWLLNLFHWKGIRCFFPPSFWS